MGSGASTATAISALPDHFNEITLEKLVGGTHQLNRHFYENFKDKSTGLISKNVVLEYAKLRDVYISFAWGKDHERRWTQERLSILVKMLRLRGISCHFDDNFEEYKRKHESCIDLIDNAQLFVCCATSKYMERVNRINGMKPNKNSFEFNHALHTKGLPRMVFLLLDSSVFNVVAWEGRMAKANQSLNPYHDFATDADFERKISILLANILSLITPLRDQTFGVTLTHDEAAVAESELRDVIRNKSPMLRPSEWVTTQVKLIAQSALLGGASSSPTSPPPSSSSAKIAHLYSLGMLVGMGMRDASMDDNELDLYYERLGEMTTLTDSQLDKDSASRFFILEKQSQDDMILSRISKKATTENEKEDNFADNASPHTPYEPSKSPISSPHQRTKSRDFSRRGSRAGSEMIDYQALLEARERNMLMGSEKSSSTAVLEAKVQARLDFKRSEKELRRLSQIPLGTTPESASFAPEKTESNHFRDGDDDYRRDNVLPMVQRSKLQRQSSLQQIANRKFSDPLIASSLVHALFGHGPSHAMVVQGLENSDHPSFATTPRQFSANKYNNNKYNNNNNNTNNMEGILESTKSVSISSILDDATRDEPTHEGDVQIPTTNSRVSLSPLFRQTSEPPPFVIQRPQKVSLNPKLEAQWRQEKEYLERLAKKGVFVAAGTTTDSLLALPSLDMGGILGDGKKKVFEKKTLGFSEKTEISMAGTAYTLNTGRHTGLLTDGENTGRLSMDDASDVFDQYASDLMKEVAAKTPETERMNEAETQRYLLWQEDQDQRIAPNAWSAPVPKKKVRVKRNTMEKLLSNNRSDAAEGDFVSDMAQGNLLQAMKAASRRGSMRSSTKSSFTARTSTKE